jgi:hypothetical protein
MSFDTLVSLTLFVGALFLMMRFGCGAHMGHAHRHRGPTADQSGGGAVGAGVASLSGARGALSASGAKPEKISEHKAHRHGCC